MRPKRPRAVLFDLFITLVPGGTRDERDTVSRVMAEVLDVAPEPLAALVRDTFDDRTRGRLGDLPESVRWLAGSLGATPSVAALATTVERRTEMTRSLHQRTWAVPALEALGAGATGMDGVEVAGEAQPAFWP
jgi:putative hydrolase of the HAD superfamily